MIRPASFGANPETAASNAFQQSTTSLDPKNIQNQALREFDAMVEKMTLHDIDVMVFEDSEDVIKPDAVFPNNWFSTHSGGTFIYYPMYSKIRRKERRVDVMEALKLDYQIDQILFLEDFESEERYLEGTGSLVLDRVNRMAYACSSIRTDRKVLEVFCDNMGFEYQLFEAFDADGKAIYHTNVVMAVGDGFVVICLQSIKDEHQRKQLTELFEMHHQEVIELDFKQLHAFAGNLLQIENKKQEKIIVLSDTALKSLGQDQLAQLKRFGMLLPVEIPTIEKFGGGSARCMIAEIFLNRREEV